MHVEIWSEGVTLVGVVSLIDGKAVPSNDALAAELASLVVADVDNNILTLDDGEAYLRRLEFIYSGLYVRATLIP